MAKHTKIEWCDSTANLWIGCSKTSGACANCYAEAEQDHRRHRVTWGPQGARSYCKQGWSDLRRWQRAAEANGGVDPELGRRRVVFINSLSDFCDNHRSVIWRPAAWELFRECTHLILIIVTKRPQLIARYLPAFWDEIAHRVALLTTVEDQANDWRVLALLKSCEGRAKPALFGLSCEPLLGPLSFEGMFYPHANPAVHINMLEMLGWVIVGGESGPNARPMHIDWARTLHDECEAFGTPFLFKQWGEYLPEGQIDRTRFEWCPGAKDPTVHWWQDVAADAPIPDGACSVRVGRSVAGRYLDRLLRSDLPLTRQEPRS